MNESSWSEISENSRISHEVVLFFFLEKFREMLFQSEISGNSKWKFSPPKVMKPDNAVFLASFDLI